MNKILLVGCGGHAKSVIDIVESSENWQIGGLVGLEREIGNKVLGYEVLCSDNKLNEMRKLFNFAFVSVGKIGECTKRNIIFENLNLHNFQIPNLVSRKAYISSHATLDQGSFLGHGVIINSAAKIGSNCIINSNALIEHDVEIGKNCHISTGVIINGGCKIGDNSFIGSGTIIREGIKLPKDTTISAGKCIMGWPMKNILI